MTSPERVGHKMNVNVAVNVAGCLGRLPALAKIALLSLAVIFTLAACAPETPPAPDDPPAQARAADTPTPEPTPAPLAMIEDTPAPPPEAAATPPATAAPVQAPTAMAAPTAAPVAAPTAAAPTTAAPDPTPTAIPQPASTPTPAATSTTQPTSTPVPAPTSAPQPTSTPVPAPTAAPQPTSTPVPAPTATPATSGPPSIVLNPSSAAPGITVTITGSNLPASTPVTQIRIGGRAAGPGAVTGPDGSFSAEVRVPIALSFGTHTVQVTVGDRTISAPLTVAPSAPFFRGTPVAQAFAPLGSNLRWVAFYDSEAQDWLLYDPHGTFSPDQLVTPAGSPDPNTAGSLTHIEAREVYQVAVTNTQTVSLGGRSRSLTGGGYNFVLW